MNWPHPINTNASKSPHTTLLISSWEEGCVPRRSSNIGQLHIVASQRKECSSCHLQMLLPRSADDIGNVSKTHCIPIVEPETVTTSRGFTPTAVGLCLGLDTVVRVASVIYGRFESITLLSYSVSLVLQSLNHHCLLYILAHLFWDLPLEMWCVIPNCTAMLLSRCFQHMQTLRWLRVFETIAEVSQRLVKRTILRCVGFWRKPTALHKDS